MPRQLNKDIFEEQISIKPFSKSRIESPELLVQDNTYKLRGLEQKINNLTKQVETLHLKLPQLESLYKNLFEKNTIHTSCKDGKKS